MKQKKTEWSKIISGFITALFGGFSLWSIYKYYQLAQMAIITGAVVLPDPTIAVTCITVVIGALLSYFLYQFGLKNSRNKYGVDAEGNPYKQKIEYEENVLSSEFMDNTEIDNLITEINNLEISNDEEAKG